MTCAPSINDNHNIYSIIQSSILLSLYDTNLSTFTNLFFKLFQIAINCKHLYFLQTPYANVDSDRTQPILICSTVPTTIPDCVVCKIGVKRVIFEPENIKMHCFSIEKQRFRWSTGVYSQTDRE